MNDQKNFMGIGWAFPVQAEQLTGRVKESGYEENIASCIKIILQTQKGERVMNPEFGCNLQKYAFSQMNYTVMSEIEADIKNALIMWEPRIINVEISCRMDDSDKGVLLIDISYVVRSTNNPFNLVYPFYLNESV